MSRFSALRDAIKTAVPRPVARLVWNAAADLKDMPGRLSGNLPPQPFRVMHNVGGGDYHQIGQYFAHRIAERTGLAADWSLLDIGCGTGRIAAPLIEKLGCEGLYTGFDLSAAAIDWAQKHIARDRAGVQFVRADLSNTEYNKDGAARASEYRFPAEDESVDLCFAISLFTHLKAGDAIHYLEECGRVLRPGGKAFLTAFIMTLETQAQIEQGASRMRFQRLDANCYTTDLKTPEHATAFDRSDFINWAERAGLTLSGDIKPGAWPALGATGDLQDELVFEKSA